MAQLASFDDAFGWMLLDHLDGRAMTAWLECDDGRSQPALGPSVDRILGYRDEPAAYAAVLRRDG